jgi:hypothetical protein
MKDEGRNGRVGADGRAFDVPHTDFISISQAGRRVIVE